MQALETTEWVSAEVAAMEHVGPSRANTIVTLSRRRKRLQLVSVAAASCASLSSSSAGVRGVVMRHRSRGRCRSAASPDVLHSGPHAGGELGEATRIRGREQADHVHHDEDGGQGPRYLGG